MDERKIQKDYVMNYLCRREDEGGLGYRNVAPNVVDNAMFIPSVLAEFISTTQPAAWGRLLRQFHNDERALQAALVKEIREKVVERQNVAIFFNQFKNFKFEHEELTLFYVPGTELRGDEDFHRNIFCAVEEAPHRRTTKFSNQLITAIRPDVTFYLNGIYLGYMELKSALMGQNAKEHGRGKVMKDYLAAVRAIVQAEQTDSRVTKQKKALLAIYEKAIHITTSDINATYVMRNMAQLYDAAHAAFTVHPSTATIDALVPDALKQFKPYPVSTDNLTEKQRFEEVMRALYSKEAIKNEILYYNFIEYRYEKAADGTRSRKSNSGRLISPRPKQKFGCDKIMHRIREMLDNEANPDYYTDKLRRELRTLGIPTAKAEEIIAKRERFCNNKFVYSLLMQYAAGFGKSNIIGWTALQLKDYRYQGAYAYDKVMLVVDRLQLRDQLDERMCNMNIDKSMFVEATDKETFIRALDDHRRIIVVNIQKFLDLQRAIDDAGMRLKNMRVAFLIDEIHRSNSGENNKEMINLFERLQDSFNHGEQRICKKNLLIGFTATPSDETLSRFGEFRSATTVPLWVPFDTYSMKEAISDGYILDPTEHIIPYNVPVGFDLPAGLDLSDDNLPDVRQNKQKVYESEPRMRKIASFVVDRLVSLVFGKIGGQGKAMLAVSSIPIAIRYTRIIRELFAAKCQEKLYARYANAPIVVVYSDSQRYESCASMNGGMPEAQVIERFKSGKNGLVIVVDKLQTGFDEPKLHTLFLDKEIKDINAIQTISRVNRTCKNKRECHVVDCSWKNVNTRNIMQAFKKYCDKVFSQFNPEEEAKLIARYYKEMSASEPYLQWFARFTQQQEDADFLLDLENGFRTWITACMAREAALRQHNEELGLQPGDAGYTLPENAAKQLRFIVGRYASALMSLKNVYDIPAKYADAAFLAFWQTYCRIFRDATKNTAEEGYTYDVTDTDQIPGITAVGDVEEENPPSGAKHPKAEPTEKRPKEVSLEKILELLKRLNEQELISAREAQMWLKEIGVMFEHLRQNEKLCVILRDVNTLDDEKQREYRKQQNIYKLVELKRRPDIAKVDTFKKMLDDNVEQFYSMFVEQLQLVDNGESDFDYDTTTSGSESVPEPASMDELMEIIRKKWHPDYDEAALKARMCQTYASHFEPLGGRFRPFREVVDNLFMVLNTSSIERLDGVDGIVKESLNMLCMAEGLSANEKRMHMNQLLMRYESFLKKLYYLIHHRELADRDPERDVTLSSAIFGFPSLKRLKYSTNPAVKPFSEKLDMLRQLRNDEAHSSSTVTELEIDMAIGIVTDMYLYVVGTNITELEMNGLDAAYPGRSVRYQPSDDDAWHMVAERSELE